MLVIKRFLIVASLIVLISNISTADWKEDAEAIRICGGEDYTLVLTNNQWLWACGDNYYYQLGIGNTQTDQFNLVRVHGPGDVGFLEDINDFDAGWMHSLALDVNGFVWAWGKNQYGQLGDNKDSGNESTTPIKVHGGAMGTDYLENIIAVAAGQIFLSVF